MPHPSHQSLFDQALHPFSTNTGTSYPCQQSEIDFHTLPKFPYKNKTPFIKPNNATAALLWHNSILRSIPTSESAAIARLQAAIPPVLHNIGPDLAIKAFHDLDTVFFASRLHSHVTATWLDSTTSPQFHQFLSPATLPPLGYTDRDTKNRLFKERGQCRIVLNARILAQERGGEHPMKIMLETLLHEMVHAYRFVMESIWRVYFLGCGFGGRGEYGDGHDVHFGSRISVVGARAERLLGLRAVHPLEPYRCHHFLEIEEGDMGVRGCGGSGGGRGRVLKRVGGKLMRCRELMTSKIQKR